MDRPCACILAGGRGRRFGSDKTLLRKDGRLLVAHLGEQLQAAGFHVTLLTNGAPHLAGIGDAILHDRTPHAGPLQTIYHAFCQLPYNRCLVVAADMPFLPPAVARLLWTASAAASITHLSGSRISTSGAPDQPLCGPRCRGLRPRPGAASSVSGPLPGVYARTLAPRMKALLCRDERRLQTLLLQVGPGERQVLPAAAWRTLDPEGHALININTPEDWAAVSSDTPHFSV